MQVKKECQLEKKSSGVERKKNLANGKIMNMIPYLSEQQINGR